MGQAAPGDYLPRRARAEAAPPGARRRRARPTTLRVVLCRVQSGAESEGLGAAPCAQHPLQAIAAAGNSSQVRPSSTRPAFFFPMFATMMRSPFERNSVFVL